MKHAIPKLAAFCAALLAWPTAAQPAGICSAEPAAPVASPAASPAPPEASGPAHPYLETLIAALDRETDADRRATLAANIDRWRAMPAALGERYLLVNAASFEMGLWENGVLTAVWPVIIGKPRTPTPIFDTTVTGVVFNPWWDIPASIVRESVGALMRNRPAEARRRGYVVQNGRYRQRPGPGNALGQMKLVMPNRYSVGVHDTPNRDLFRREDRALSHGCVRVGDALGFAARLLAARADWGRAEIDAAVAAGDTVTVDLAEPIPIYVGYFTAEPGADEEIRYYRDIYGRD